MSKPLHHYAAATAERAPDAVAVRLGEESLTYAELVSQGRSLAGLLREAGVGSGDRVALLTGKTPLAIVAMHAVLEASAAYVPVDLASPASRAELMVRSAQPKLVLASKPAADLLAALMDSGALEGARVLALDGPWEADGGGAVAVVEDWRSLADRPLTDDRGPDDLAHVLFTSGSTGVPKGVKVTHSMAAAFIDWACGHFGHRPGERISGHTPLHFDLSTFDIYATFAAGAELHMIPPAVDLLPKSLINFIREHELHQWFSVPSSFTFMLKGKIEQDDFPSLRRVLFCGEVMPTPVLAEWMRKVPHPTYTNLYGPTEAAIASSYHDVPEVPMDETRQLPIGVPCEGEELHVVDDQFEPVADGEIGELHISGVGLSPGYWRDPAKTDTAFHTRLSDGLRMYRTGDLARRSDDGNLHFHGRIDSQVQHRGHRIELGEIEAALAAVRSLAESAVVAVDTEDFESNRLCCGYVCQPSQQVTMGELRSALRESLPSYMLPTEWIEFEQLPKNATGKIDRRAIGERFSQELVT